MTTQINPNAIPDGSITAVKLEPTPIVDHGTSDTTFTLTSNKIHKWGTITSLTFTVPQDSNGFVSQYKVIFTAGTNFTLSIPDTMIWAGGEIPEFEEGKIYELNIEDSRITFASF